MQTLKIEIPKGYEIDSFDKLSGEIKFKAAKPNVMERIKTIDDVLADNGITQSTFNDWSEDLSQDEVAYRTLKLLTKSLNEGWVPDWSNAKEYKYFPWFEMGGSSGFRFDDYVGWFSNSFVGSRLCFKTSELAQYAGRQFTEVYNRFMII